MSVMDTLLQKPDSNRPVTPYEGAAFPVEPFCIIIAGTGRWTSSGRPLSADRSEAETEPAIFSV